MAQTSNIPGLTFSYVSSFRLLLLISHRATASIYYVSFSPAIYIYENGISNPTAPAGAPSGLPSIPTTTPSSPAATPSSLPALLSPTNDPSPSDPYNPQTPSPSPQAQPSNSKLPTYTPPPSSAPVPFGLSVTAIPPSSGLLPYNPTTPLTSEATVSCATIGEPWWVCTSTKRCAFDDAGDMACCPVGEFCRGIIMYGAGAGPMYVGRTSGGEKRSKGR